MSECDCEASIMRRPWPTRGCCAMETTNDKINLFSNAYVCMNVCMFVCMCVCVYMYVTYVLPNRVEDECARICKEAIVAILRYYSGMCIHFG
jgi:hypothetical protein